MHKCFVGLGSLQCSPGPLAGFNGFTREWGENEKRMGRTEWERRDGKGKGGKRQGRGREKGERERGSFARPLLGCFRCVCFLLVLNEVYC